MPPRTAGHLGDLRFPPGAEGQRVRLYPGNFGRRAQLCGAGAAKGSSLCGGAAGLQNPQSAAGGGHPSGVQPAVRSVFWLPSQKDAAAGIDRHQWQDHQCLDAPPCAGSSGNQGGLDWDHLQPHRGIAHSACALHHTRCLGASAAACHDV